MHVVGMPPYQDNEVWVRLLKFGKLHRAMLERGVYLAPSAFEAGFTSLAHSDADIEATIQAFRESFAAVA